MLVEHFDRQLVLALQREDVGKLESSVFHVGQFSCQLKSTMTCIFLYQTFCCSVADPIKLFFFADEEFFHFLLLREVVLLSMNFFSMLLTRKLNSENWKMKKFFFVISATEMHFEESEVAARMIDFPWKSEFILKLAKENFKD